MSKELQGGRERESKKEKLARFGRNINFIGAAAIAGTAAVIPGPNVVLGTWAAVNAVQGGGFELLRRWAKKKRTK